MLDSQLKSITEWNIFVNFGLIFGHTTYFNCREAALLEIKSTEQCPKGRWTLKCHSWYCNFCVALFYIIIQGTRIICIQELFEVRNIRMSCGIRKLRSTTVYCLVLFIASTVSLFPIFSLCFRGFFSQTLAHLI